MPVVHFIRFFWKKMMNALLVKFVIIGTVAVAVGGITYVVLTLMEVVRSK